MDTYIENNSQEFYPIYLEKYAFGDLKNYADWHADLQILFCYKNKGIVIVDNDNIPVVVDEFCIFPPYSAHTMMGKPNDFFYFYELIISDDFLMDHGIDVRTFIFDEVFKDSFLKKLLLDMYHKLHKEKPSPTHDIEIYSLACQFSAHLFKYHARYAPMQSVNKNIYYAIGYIKANLNNKITIADIADNIGFSPDYFAKEFKKITGKTVMEYVNFLRCSSACRLLSTTNYSVYQVFEKSAFSSYAHFINTFKKNIGVTPSKYLAHYKEKNEKIKNKL